MNRPDHFSLFRRVFFFLNCLLSTVGADAYFRGEVSLRNDSFISSNYENTKTPSYNFFGGKISTIQQSINGTIQENGLHGDVEGVFSPQAPVLSYHNISQLYFRDNAFSVGRKLEDWSLLDESWHLGIYQPQFKWNPVNPSSQGLTGIYADLKSEDATQPWGLTLMGSWMFIPDQGAGFEIKDGQFEASNPWFRAPPRYAQYDSEGKIIDRIEYNIIRPQTNDILFNNSWIAKAYLGDAYDGFFVQAASAYKPSNQLSLGMDVRTSSNEVVIADVSPKIYYHSIVSADSRLSNKFATIGLGMLRDKPKSPQYDEVWNYVEYGESILTSPYLELRYRGFSTRFSHLQIQSENTTYHGPKISKLEPMFTEKYPFKRAGKLEASNRYYWKKQQGMKLKGSYTQGDNGGFEIFNAGIEYQQSRNWTMHSQVLLLRSDANLNSYYSDYQDNDQVQMGVSYVF